MQKTIIAIYGRANEGKSETIKQVCKTLEQYPNAQLLNPNLDYNWDILQTITLGTVKIGIESQGDPNSRMIKEDTIRDLADNHKCNIIICATRTQGETVHKVDEIARIYNFHTLWISSFWCPSLNHKVLNVKAAENIIQIIKSLIVGEL